MLNDNEYDNRTYVVVVNSAGQYSVWLAERKIPLGWEAAGKKGTKEECLDYIEEVWTDVFSPTYRERMLEKIRQEGK